jgi:hypothetical protein
MEAHEASHIVESPLEDASAHKEEPANIVARLETAERFRRSVALWVAVVAVMLAITSMAREQAANRVLNANIHASDTYNFFQAKNIRQTSNQIAADELGTLLVIQIPSEPLKSELERRLAGYVANVARYESEPETGEGKRELLETAQHYESEREKAEESLHSLHYSSTLFQVAIVLGSVAILALSRPVVIASGVATGVAVSYSC